MKKAIFILVFLTIATASYNQTSRRSSSSTRTTDSNNSQTSTTRSSDRSSSVSTESRSRQASPRTSTNSSRSAETTTRTSRGSSTAAPSSSRSQTVQHSATRRTSNSHVVEYRSPRVHRTHHRVRHHYSTPPHSRDYRRTHHAYRSPVTVDFCWTPEIHRHFIHIYPMVNRWEYRTGSRFEVISAYDAIYYRGDVATVYGKVTEVIYSRATDEYFLYFGPHYPYHDFTMVMPGYLARTYSRSPARYFEHQHIAVSGLITSYQGEPEIYVKEKFQISFY